jgi:hypothetical protein
MSDEPKKKLPVRRLNPPRRLHKAQAFAFISPLPLDTVSRRLIASNNASIARTLFGEIRTDANLISRGMNTMQFIFRSSHPHNPIFGWAVGTLDDVDGEQTQVAGRMGIALADYVAHMASLILLLAPLIAICAILVLAPGGNGFFDVAGVLIAGMILFILTIRGRDTVHLAELWTNSQLRQIFGLDGEGPLPEWRALVEETEHIL